MIIGPGISLLPGISVQSFSTPPIPVFYAITATLSSSLAAYNSANTNQAVPITAAEYANLQILYGSTQTSVSDDGFGNGWFVATNQVGTGTQVLRNGVFTGVHAPASGFNGRLMTTGYTYAFKVLNRFASAATPFVSIGYAVSTNSSAVSLCYLPSSTPLSDANKYTYYVIKNPTFSLSTASYYPTLWQGTGTATAGGFNGALAGLAIGQSTYYTPAANVTVATTLLKPSGIDELLGYQFLQTPYVNWTQTPDLTQTSSGTNMLSFNTFGSQMLLTNPGFAIGTGDFTVEAWFQVNSSTLVSNSNANTSATTVIGNVGICDFVGIGFYATYIIANAFGNSFVLYKTPVTLANATWYHVAVTRVSGTLSLWLNGSLQQSTTRTDNSTSTQLILGGENQSLIPNGGFIGYIRDFRFTTKGVYTGSFTPPARGKISYTQVAGTNITAISAGQVICLLTLPQAGAGPYDWTYNTTLSAGPYGTQTMPTVVTGT